MRSLNSCLSIGNPQLIDPDSTILFDLKNNTGTKISVAACYAPSHKDDDEYLLKVKSTLDQRTSPFQLLLGDLNTVLDPERDRTGYVTDPHTKSRAVLEEWDNQEELIDCYRHEHPEERCYTFRTKNQLKKARLDYAFASPPLMEHIVDIDHHYIDEELTDHSATIIQLDITKYTRGPGIFKAHPLIEQNSDYRTLINNTIRATLLKNIRDKDEMIYDNQEILRTKCSLQEELHLLKKLKREHKWETSDRQKELLTKIVSLCHLETTNEKLIHNYPLSTSYSSLLTETISHIQSETIYFQKNLFCERKAKKKKTATTY